MLHFCLAYPFFDKTILILLIRQQIVLIFGNFVLVQKAKQQKLHARSSTLCLKIYHQKLTRRYSR